MSRPHNVVTFVNTSGTVYTFELSSVTNVDTGRANVYTLFAIDTISETFLGTVLIFSEFCSALFPFSTNIIIGNNDRFIIKQNTLHSPVRTSNDTHLLSEPGKYEIKNCRKNQ